MKNIAVLMGGYSHEWEISMKSGAVIAQNLDSDLYNIYSVAILKEGWYYKDATGERYEINKNDFSLSIDGEKVTFDCCYNTIHGTPGEDGIIQAMLELLHIPQTSCDYYQSAITFNKRDCIAILKPWNITTGRHMYLNQGDSIDAEIIARNIGLPCFVKANRSGSSFGVSKVYKVKDMDAALENAFSVDNEIIIESFLDGVEVSVGAYQIDNEIKVLLPTEIVSENDFFDYEAKYQGKSQEITPARISEDHTNAVQDITRRIYQVLKLKGLARADFIFHNNIPHFIEVNTNPGMSEESIIPQQIKASGATMKNVFTQIIENTIKHHNS
ncbi:D-alanine--D-alanine ligase [Nonlabens sp. MB-3u-79]|uniref:D-alanine--D-alanine ligase n=1 Tax=Nonlabens sp. MB-3u-79 TaxID=2058134 RepID=UPI000C318FB2|nr:D-alanine--D-alanine ligase [Nonlabens sp. MB-3u-79]AUC79187.1 D-alanine--D-alanine ligase [Nonlabens sp. MB-3u-79]|tara:strand:+ start:280 stop:1263 length:984 start_codon:yes stop_codon:yes gene_type:complete